MPPQQAADYECHILETENLEEYEARPFRSTSTSEDRLADSRLLDLQEAFAVCIQFRTPGHDKSKKATQNISLGWRARGLRNAS